MVDEPARSDMVDAGLVDMGWAGHYLLSRIPDWNAFATENALGLLG